MSDFITVCKVSDVPDPGKKVFQLQQQPVILFHKDGEFYALDDTCTHDGGSLHEGTVRGFEIACPRHGSKFDIRTGQALTLPAARATTVHQVKLEGENVLVKLRRQHAARGPMPF